MTISQAVEGFKTEYCQPKSGIIAVTDNGEAIIVSVTCSQRAHQLPHKYMGFPVRASVEALVLKQQPASSCMSGPGCIDGIELQQNGVCLSQIWIG